MARSPKESKQDAPKQSDDDILRRMLSTPPKPHAPKAKPMHRTAKPLPKRKAHKR